MNSIEKLINKLRERNIDSAILSDPNVILYFTGIRFYPGERMLVLLVKSDGTVRFYLNKLFMYNGTIEAKWYSDADDGVALLAEELNRTVAIDKNWQSHFLLRLMDKRKDLNFIQGTVIDEIKAIKTPEEIEKMVYSSKKNDEVMAKVAEMIQIGKSEAQLRNEIAEEFDKIGSPSFDTIVLYGDHAADPHGMAGERILKEGECVVVDMGAVVNDYCSDMTRTFFVGENTEKEIYDIVLKANLAGIAAVKPGIPFKDVDRAARKVIEDAGYGEYFIHRLGHGIGLEVHEPFDVSATDEVIIQEGMCFSIEPGIYIPGRVGIRIEDLVYVGKDGAVVMNHYPKDKEVLHR